MGARTTYITLALLIGALGVACQKIDREGTPLEQTAAPSTKQAANADQPIGGPPMAPPVVGGNTRPECKLNKLIREPQDGTAEKVVATLYEAAIGPDDEATFQLFYEQFLPKHREAWVREQYWPRIRQHVGKYLVSQEPVAFYVCRALDVSGGVKLFVRSNDPKKSDPPITLLRTPDGWKVDYFTY